MVASYFLDMVFPCLGKFLKPLPYCKKLRYWCSCSGLRKIPHNAWSNGMSAKKYLSLSMDLAKQGSYLVCGYFMVAVASLGKAKQRNQSLSHHVRWMKAKYVNERLGWAWRIPSACHASLPEAARRIVLFLLLIIHPCWIYMVLRLGHQQTIIRTLHNHLINVQGILLSLTGSKPAPNLRFKILSNTGQVMGSQHITTINCCWCRNLMEFASIPGWWFEPLCKILVNWDDEIPNIWENKWK